jgi:hypothetical protein
VVCLRALLSVFTLPRSSWEEVVGILTELGTLVLSWVHLIIMSRAEGQWLLSVTSWPPAIPAFYLHPCLWRTTPMIVLISRDPPSPSHPLGRKLDLSEQSLEDSTRVRSLTSRRRMGYRNSVSTWGFKIMFGYSAVRPVRVRLPVVAS